MKTYDFIFSIKPSHRLARHFIFWMVFLVYFYYVNLIPSRPEDLSNTKTYLAAFELMIYFPVSVISVYVAIYFLLPRYILTEKYFKLFLIVAALTVIYFFIALLLTMLLARLTTNIPFQRLPIAFKWFQPVRYGIGLPLTSAVLTTIIKLFKTWQREQKENELLQRKKINTEMQLLKTQFQPYFLYDSLEHLFNLIQEHSPQSPQTVLNLSDLLSYVLYENERDIVPLEKELQIVKTYLELKKIFYPGRLWTQVKQGSELNDINIAPLLIVSLVEDCLEKYLHLETQTLSLKLEIKTEPNEIHFLIMCKSNLAKESDEKNEGHQWIKSLKRIEMLYEGKHSFIAYSKNARDNLFLVIKTDKPQPATIKSEKEKFVLS